MTETAIKILTFGCNYFPPLLISPNIQYKPTQMIHNSSLNLHISAVQSDRINTSNTVHFNNFTILFNHNIPVDTKQ